MPDTDQPPEPSRAARRAQKTRQRLLESALIVFTQRGIDDCAIEDITEHADVGKGTFYRHFDDKQAILCALTQAATADLAAALRDRAQGAASLEDALARLMEAESTWLQRRDDGFRLLLQVQAQIAVRPAVAGPLQASFAALVSTVEAVLAPWSGTPADPALLRRLALTALSVLPGALAFGRAVPDADQAGTAAALRTVMAGALPQLLRCTV